MRNPRRQPGAPDLFLGEGQVGGHEIRAFHQVQRRVACQGELGEDRQVRAPLLGLPRVRGHTRGVAGYVWVVLNWSFSSGERAGYLQKFSHRGWICKTWEGELQMLPVPGAVPEKFLFSVRDEALAQKINALIGRKVALTYGQHKGIPTDCFGETEYFVTAVKPLD